MVSSWPAYKEEFAFIKEESDFEKVVEQQKEGLKKALDKIKIIEESISELKNM